jgi:BASS family bile acid:Na+ symporter
MLKKSVTFLSDNLMWLVIAAGVLGFVLAPLANILSSTTSYLLALMMVGSGLSLALPQVFQLAGTGRLTLLTLILQLGLLPLVGFGLYQLLPNPVLAIGMLALGVAPSEITSALMTMMAGGNLALAMRLMTFSIFLSVFLTPVWLGLFLGKSVALDLGSMAVELGLIIALPFLLASGVRTRFPQISKYNDEFGGISAVALLALIFVVGGSIASFSLNLEIVWLVLACLAFNLVGYGLGWVISSLTKQKPAQTVALVFSSGMREFGIATAVALNFLPNGAALAPALYGLIMMVSASLLAARFKKRLAIKNASPAIPIKNELSTTTKASELA